MDNIPKKVFDSLPRYSIKEWKKQLDERHTIFTNVGALGKKRDALFTTLATSLRKWVSVPVTPRKLMYTIGLQLAHKHPEICLFGRVPTKDCFDVFDAIEKHLPLKPGQEYELQFGYSKEPQVVKLTFHRMEGKAVGENMEECVQFYGLYFDRLHINALYADFHCKFVERYTPKKLDEIMMKEMRAEVESLKKCFACGKSEEKVKLMTCSRCGKASYCSRECQRKHWKKHKKMCKK